MNKKTLAAGAIALAVTFAASACSDSGGDEATTATATSVPTSAEANSARFDQDDVMFSRMMIPHHAQAIEMSDMLLAKDGIPEPVRALAEQIKAEQQPEIEQFEAWLEEWGMPMHGDDAPGMNGHMSGMPPVSDMPGMDDMPHMDGMMSEQDMQALSDAQGVDAARLYLEQMIVHHEGAIEMAQDEIEDGQYPETVELARTIADTQQKEIDTMRQLLTTL
ncbi:DUF305 domain-containing protein [Rhodococcus pyridinivorans]|uniref:DUF305 domain-containing protein n=1 Tax=Rhodococcus pyridinivorans TaxID=103816 RepID=UPI001E5B5227|nr:DUF305 domain-containing protein [Rhodococcus pyridinivorans]UGQ59040.1 DUF305 domain-containing protein [Rhodococcus pyridinivorans]